MSTFIFFNKNMKGKLNCNIYFFITNKIQYQHKKTSKHR
jgi:hypothetical protein